MYHFNFGKKIYTIRERKVSSKKKNEVLKSHLKIFYVNFKYFKFYVFKEIKKIYKSNSWFLILSSSNFHLFMQKNL